MKWYETSLASHFDNATKLLKQGRRELTRRIIVQVDAKLSE